MIPTILIMLFVLGVPVFIASLIMDETIKPQPQEISYPSNYAATVAKLSKILAESPLPTEAFDKVVENAKRIREN